MIFDNNSTALGSMDIPVVEGYDFQTGTAKLLIESARNDYAMFKAMLSVDSKEAQIKNESADYVMEGELMSLSEAAGSGIWQKIVELFNKLLAKIRSIFSNFIARLTGLVAKDKTLVKKYKSKILNKGSVLNNMEIKYSKVKSDPIEKNISTESLQLNDLLDKYDDNRDEMVKTYLSDQFPGTSGAPTEKSEYAKALHEFYFEEQTTGKVKDFNTSIAAIVTWFENYEKKLKTIKENQKKLETNIANIIKQATTKKNNASKNADATKPDSLDELSEAKKIYDSGLVYQEIVSYANKCLLNEIHFDYKQHKAVFMKAVTVDPNKLQESSIYADAVAEAAADNVDDVISGYISKEELSEFNAASKNVLDADVTDDPYANEYDKVSHYTNSPAYKTDGSINTNINSRTESYDFGSLLY